MKWLAFLFLSCTLAPTLGRGQSAAIKQADALLDQAYKYLEKGIADSSIHCHNKALALYAANDSLVLWHRSFLDLAYAWARDHKQPFVGLDLLDRAIQQAPRQPKTPAEWEQVCVIYLAKAYIYEQNVDDLEAAKRECGRGFQVFVEQLGEHCNSIAAYIYYKYGNLFTRLGDYEHAQVLLQAGIDYAKRYKFPDAAKYGDLAIILFELNKKDAGKKAIQEGLLHKGTYTEPMITVRLGEVSMHLDDGNIAGAKQAVAHIPGLMRRAEKEDEWFSPDYYMAGYYSALAEILDASGEHNEAIKTYRKAIQSETDAFETTERREVGKIYSCIGDIYLRQGNAAKALEEHQMALKSVLPKFRPNKSYENPHDSLFKAENTILEALEGKAEAFLALGQLEKALECYELIPLVEAKIRATHAYESSKLLALSESRQRFDAALGVAWQLYERNNHDRRYADRAFRLTEQARGMLLLQSLAQAQVNYGLPMDVRQRETELNEKLAWLEHEIADEREAGDKGDKPRLARLEKDLLDLKHNVETFKAELRLQFPDYAALSDKVQFLESGAVYSLLRNNQALIDYYLTEQDIFVFSFDQKGGFNWRKTPLPTGFKEAVVAFVQYLQKGDESDKAGEKTFRIFANVLYELLLAPELQRMMPQEGSLMIIPDDALVFVPFEVLLRKPVTDGNWRDLPWLLAKYNTGYAYSATLLQLQQNISRKHQSREQALPYAFGGFAPSYASSGLYKLSSTDAMVNNAQKLLGGQTWCGTAASEEQFKKVAPDCRILVLAMHGIADAEHPELSRLLFGDPGSDSLENNNVLYASELQIMQLQADLAVLSACHSGFGNFQKGEGVFSLARAFARAGVPATFMSRWLLHENAAVPLVQTFLEYVQAGYSKDKALRKAKMDFLKNNDYFEMGHPFYWAGVTTTGDMCALEKGASYWWLALVVLALLLLIKRRLTVDH